MKDMFDRGKEGAISVGRNFTVFVYLSLSAVLGMILFGEEAIYILAPPSYYNAINVMLILLCGIAAQAFGKIVGLPLSYAKKAYLSVPISFAGVAVNVLLNLILIPRWGAVGAGLATVATIFITNSICFMVSQRCYHIIYERKILSLLYLNVFFSAIVLIFFRKVGAPLFIKYSFKTILLGLFIVLGMQARIVTSRNMKIVLNIFMSRKNHANT